MSLSNSIFIVKKKIKLYKVFQLIETFARGIIVLGL